MNECTQVKMEVNKTQVNIVLTKEGKLLTILVARDRNGNNDGILVDLLFLLKAFCWMDYSTESFLLTIHSSLHYNGCNDII